jgi:hypothetical protein
LIDEFRSSQLDIIEVIEDDLHGTEELELILNLNKIVTLTSVKTCDLNGN